MKKIYLFLILLGTGYFALSIPNIGNKINTIFKEIKKEKSGKKTVDIPQKANNKGKNIRPKAKKIGVVVASISAAQTVAVEGGGNAVPGGQLNYSFIVNNSGSSAANNVTFTDQLITDLTLVAGSLKATPIAGNDAYSVTGNVGITVPTASGVMANDNSPTGLGMTVAVATNVANGVLNLASDGSFTYLPTAGYVGADSFTYTLTTGAGANLTTSIGTVNLTIANMFWFVNPTVGASGTGTLQSPFKNMSDITGTAAGNTIFVYAGSPTGAVTLLNNQKLVGQGASAPLVGPGSITGVTVQPFSNPFPSTGGARPTWTHNATALTLASTNDIEGIDITTTGGTTVTGASVGDLKVKEVALNNTNGQALQIGAGGALNIIFDYISSANGAKGISVNNATGSFQITGTGTTTGTGGTILSKTTRGAEFINCTNITLKNMNFTSANTGLGSSSPTDYSTANGAITLNNVSGVTLTKIIISGTTRERGITGKTISNFTLNGGSTITDCGDEVNEGCLYLQDLTGTCNITDAVLSKGSENVARVFNNSGTLVLNIGAAGQTTTFQNTQEQNANMPAPGTASALRSYCFIFTTGGANTGTATLNVRNSSFLKAGTHGFKVISDGTAAGTTNVNIKDCIFNNTNATIAPNDQGGSIELTSFNTSNMNFNVLNNNCIGKDIALINIVAQVASNAQGRVNGNTVSINNATDAGNCIHLSSETNSIVKAEVSGNTVTQNGTGVGIYARASGNTPSNGSMNVSILNNIVTNSDGSSHNIQVEAGSSSATGANTTCANVANNTTSRPSTTNGFNFRVRRVSATGSFTMNLVNNALAATAWANNGNTPSAATNVAQASTANAVVSCPTPSNPSFARIGVEENLVVNNLEDKTNETPITAENTQQIIDESGINTDFGVNKSFNSEVKPVINTNSSQPSGAKIKSGVTITVNGSGSGFTIPAGKSTTISFSAKITTVPSVCNITNVAEVTGSNFPSEISNTTDKALAIPGITNPSISATSVCSGGTISLTAGCPAGTVNWYNPTLSNSPIHSGSPFNPTNISTATNYYASCTIGACESVRTLVGSVSINPITLPSSTFTTITQNVSNPIFANACEYLAKVVPEGGSPVAGNVTVKSWLETAPFQYVPRHYEITPATNPNGVSGTITLYFTQADFDAYNNTVTSNKLPTGPDDTPGIANFQIAKFAGTSPTGLPGVGGYTGPPTIIPGAGQAWNTGDYFMYSSNGIWEVTFPVTSFSGFIATSASNPLPVNLISFTAKSTEKGNLLSWKTANEQNFSHFEIQRSTDAKKFEKIGQVAGNKGENYEFVDLNPASINYYRLKMIDLDGKYNYSKTISIENNIGRTIVGNFYPNPSAGKTFVEINATEKGNWNITTFDITGKALKTEQKLLEKGKNIISLEKLQQGVNFVKFENGLVSEIRKVIKE